MTTTWPLVPLGDVLNPISRGETVNPAKEYSLLGVRLDGQGPFLREKKLGGQIAASSLYKVCDGDFMYSRLFAWRGAFGVIDSRLNGCYVSGEFPVFRPLDDKIDLRFLNYWFRLPRVLERVEADCTGSTPLTRNRFKEEYFSALEIPLPPLTEQRRIVARIEELAAKIKEARRLRRQAVEKASVMKRRSVDALLKFDCEQTSLREFLREPLLNGLSLPAARMGSGDTFAKVGAVNSGRFDPTETKQADVGLVESSPYWLKPLDVLVSRGNTPDLVGRAAVYEGIPEKCAMPDLLIRIRVNEHMDPRFLAAFFHSSGAREYIESTVSGTSPTMKKISQPKLERMPVPLVPVEKQRCIVAYLDGLQSKVDALKKLQEETAKELDAMLPSVLDKAFKGEL